jgi:hypothetical protein
MPRCFSPAAQTIRLLAEEDQQPISKESDETLFFFEKLAEFMKSPGQNREYFTKKPMNYFQSLLLH